MNDELFRKGERFQYFTLLIFNQSVRCLKILFTVPALLITVHKEVELNDICISSYIDLLITSAEYVHSEYASQCFSPGAIVRFTLFKHFLTLNSWIRLASFVAPIHAYVNSNLKTCKWRIRTYILITVHQSITHILTLPSNRYYSGA